MSASPRWLAVQERGTALGIRWVVWLCTAFGRSAARTFVAVLCAYYLLTHGAARRASREYLRRVRNGGSLRDIYQHLLRFAHCTIDRLFLLRGRFDLFDVESHGTEHLREAQAAGRGAILLGAHLGSFEAMRAVGKGRGYRINIVGYFKNARRINAALRALDPDGHARFVEVEPDSVAFVLTLRDLVEKGEFVAILADRAVRDTRGVTVEFLGGPARFPGGPYVLAAALRCPVFLTFGLFREPDRYDLYCEPFADVVRLDRRDRAAAIAAYAARYAARLEHYCRMRPDNWFNFYDFWGPP